MDGPWKVCSNRKLYFEIPKLASINQDWCSCFSTEPRTAECRMWFIGKKSNVKLINVLEWTQVIKRKILKVVLLHVKYNAQIKKYLHHVFRISSNIKIMIILKNHLSLSLYQLKSDLKRTYLLGGIIRYNIGSRQSTLSLKHSGYISLKLLPQPQLRSTSF